MHVILMMAMTIDGKIGRDSDHFPDWTGSADKKLFKSLSQKAGVIAMGRKTYETIGKPLPGRKNIILTRNPGAFESSKDLVFTDHSPEMILEELEAQGYERIILAGGTKVNSLFAERNLIDEIILTISPKIFGFGLPLLSVPLNMDMKLKEFRKIDENTVLLRYIKTAKNLSVTNR